MAGITPVQKKDSLGQIGGVIQLARSAYDMGKAGDGGSNPSKIEGAPDAAIPTTPTPQQQSPAQNNSAAIDRRIKMSTQGSVGGY